MLVFFMLKQELCNKNTWFDILLSNAIKFRHMQVWIMCPFKKKIDIRNNL